MDYKWMGYVFASFCTFFWFSEDFWVIVLLLVSVFTYKGLNAATEKVPGHVARPPVHYVTPKSTVEARKEDATRPKVAKKEEPKSQVAAPVPVPKEEEKKPEPKVESEPKEEKKPEPTEASDVPVVQEVPKEEPVAQEEPKEEPKEEQATPAPVAQEESKEEQATPVQEEDKPKETTVASDPADGAEEKRLTLEESTAETDALYKKHRAQADEHARLRTQYFEEAAEAHKAGDGKRAKELSEMGKEQTKLMEEAGLKAANDIFEGKNLKQPKGTIDLHGLQVKEAELIVAREVEKAKNEGLTELKVIIGAGHHSDAKGPKVGPAVKKLVEEGGRTWRDDDTNASGGAIVVVL